ncbi:hypothetical protein MTO96_011515 [Rhipicephalus appendiculatus]
MIYIAYSRREPGRVASNTSSCCHRFIGQINLTKGRGFPVFSTDTVTCIEQENDHRQLRGASHRKTVVASCCFWTGACARNNTENDGDVPAQRLHKDSRHPVASWAWRKCCHED